MNKILVTGGCGFLGSHVCEYFKEKGWDVVSYDNLTKFEYKRTEYNVEKIRDYNLKFLEGIGVLTIVDDIRNLEQLVRVANGCNLIAHCAAQPAMTIALEDPLLDEDINIRGILNVLEAARQVGAAVVNCSTIHLYGNGLNYELMEKETKFVRPKGPIGEKEEILTGSLTPLHASKMATELYTRTYAESYGVKAASFRLTGIYGPRQFGGEDHGWVANFAIRTLMDLPIKVFGTDKQVRDILYVKDAARAFYCWYKGGCKSGIYNIGGGGRTEISIRECLTYLSELTGKKQDIKIEPARKGDLWWFISDYSKASDTFDWRPLVRPKEGLEQLVNWIKENKELFKCSIVEGRANAASNIMCR